MGAFSAAAFVPCQLASQRAAPALNAPPAAQTLSATRASSGQRCRSAPLLAGLAAAGASAAALGRRGRHAARRAVVEQRREGALRRREKEEVVYAWATPPTPPEAKKKKQALGLREQVFTYNWANLEDDPTATFRTSIGDFKVALNLKEMPVTASNFIDLVERGYYNGMHFHRVVYGFVCQFGCIHSKDPFCPIVGRGEPRWETRFPVHDGSGRRCIRWYGHIPDEFDAKLSNVAGTLSMANMGMKNSGGSQFFINMNNNTFLDWWDERAPAKHPVFGKVVQGFDVVLKISSRKTDQRDCPLEPVQVFSVTMDYPEEEEEDEEEDEEYEDEDEDEYE